jgi:membrane associated rhomboid family serine protease
MPAGFDSGTIRLASFALLAGALLLSAVVITRFGRDDDLLSPLRERFLYAVPWGTAIVVAIVLIVYYLVQGGGQDGGPIVAGFRSWSFWYPQGMVFSAFAHASQSHLTGNLFGTLAFAPLVEYAWGHYPTDNDAPRLWPTTPRSRIGLFVLAVVLFGVLSSLFVPGAVIGFSGVVFGFAGFAVVTMPLATIVAIVAIRVIRLLWEAITSPVIVAEARPRFVSPGWADVALQGHAFGFIFGVLLAVFLLRRRGQWPRVRNVWLAALLFAVTRSMFAIYWFAGTDRWILYRAFGAGAVLVLASLVALAVIRTDRVLVSTIDLSVRELAVGLLFAAVLAIALAAIPYTLVSVDPGGDIENGLEVQDYTVGYVENVDDQYVSAIDVPLVRDSLSVEVSGVVVASDDRNVWGVPVSSNQLAFQGRATIPVGDASWRETVVVNRTTWRFIDGNATYKIFGRSGDRPRKRLHAADPALSHVRLNDSRVAIRPAEEFYDIVIARGGNVVGARQIPPAGENATVGGITFQRENSTLIARHNGARIKLAKYELRRL